MIDTMTLDSFVTMTIAIAGASGAGTVLGFKVAFSQVMRAIGEAKASGDLANRRHDDHMKWHLGDAND